MSGSFTYIYVITNRDGFCKVGMAANLKRRLSALQTASPTPLEVASVWSCHRDQTWLVERAAQALLAPHRTSGEWFKISAAEAAEAVWQGAATIGATVERVEGGCDAAGGNAAFIGIRTFPDLRDMLAAAAKDEGRSMSSLINRIITDWLRKNGHLPA